MKKNRILCYGDSNTWGYIPSRVAAAERYPRDVRWTGILQEKLGNEFIILEEGLNSRTTCLDYVDLLEKNGLTSLPAILQKHFPIDLIILALGTNDLKKVFNQSPLQITQGIEKLLDCIEAMTQGLGSNPEVLLLAPAIPKLEFIFDTYRYPDLETKAKRLGPLYKKVSEERKAGFLDLSSFVESSTEDGVHFDPEEHLKIAEKLAPLVKEILKAS